MFENSPFESCPKCGRERAFGVLGIYFNSFERRCKFCRATANYNLPDLDKKVIYLDQFVVSEIFKVKTCKRRADAPHAEFWAEATELIDQAILRQQIVCPASNIHRDETMVYREGNALALAHELMGGDTSFIDTTTIEHRQLYQYLDSYLSDKNPPSLGFGVDEILEGNRNAWLPALHLTTAQIEWGKFAEITRNLRNKAAQEFAPLYDSWIRDKPTFDAALENELGDFASSYLNAYEEFLNQAALGASSGDVEMYMNGSLSPVVRLINEIRRAFVKRGCTAESALLETANFLNWPENQSMPYSWISAHLFAALAVRFSRGQRRHPSRGMMNDIKAISAYGPYVDAMFLDNECASLIEEKGFAGGVKLKARVFCLNRSNDFLIYLRQLIESTPKKVAEASEALYGIA